MRNSICVVLFLFCFTLRKYLPSTHMETATSLTPRRQMRERFKSCCLIAAFHKRCAPNVRAHIRAKKSHRLRSSLMREYARGHAPLYSRHLAGSRCGRIRLEDFSRRTFVHCHTRHLHARQRQMSFMSRVLIAQSATIISLFVLGIATNAYMCKLLGATKMYNKNLRVLLVCKFQKIFMSTFFYTNNIL